MRKLFVLLMSCAAAVHAGSALAHHSLGATYDTKRTVELKGTIAQFLFRNPHSYLHVEAPDENGVLQRYSLEWRDAGSLRAQGMGREVLSVGDEVTVTVYPSRSKADYRGALVTLHRESDGLGWGTREGEVVE